jgi:hypothetical protein
LTDFGFDGLEEEASDECPETIDFRLIFGGSCAWLEEASDLALVLPEEPISSLKRFEARGVSFIRVIMKFALSRALLRRWAPRIFKNLLLRFSNAFNLHARNIARFLASNYSSRRKISDR